MAWISVWNTSLTPLWGGALGMSHQEETPRKTQVWEGLGVMPEELQEVTGAREVWGALLRPDCSDSQL